MNHTPGPWTTRGYSDLDGYDCMTGAIWVESKDTTKTIATLDGADYGQKRCEHISAQGLATMEANARLIAAAPELLALVRRAFEDGAYGHVAGLTAEVRALLARINGDAT